MKPITILFVLSSFLVCQSNVLSIKNIKLKSGSILIDLRNMNLEEKKDVINPMMTKTNKFILHMPNYGMEVHQILLIKKLFLNKIISISFFTIPTKKPYYDKKKFNFSQNNLTNIFASPFLFDDTISSLL